MRHIQASYLGRNSFPRQLSDFEIREFFTLRPADKRAIEGTIRSRLRLPVALQLAFLQMTGTTLDAFDYIPRQVLEILGRQFGGPAPMLATLRALYRRRMTLFKHQSWALGHLGMHRYGASDAGTVADILAAECALASTGIAWRCAYERCWTVSAVAFQVVGSSTMQCGARCAPWKPRTPDFCIKPYRPL
jgi:hypothetical protein